MSRLFKAAMFFTSFSYLSDQLKEELAKRSWIVAVGIKQNSDNILYGV